MWKVRRTAVRVAWEALFEMVSFDLKAGKEKQGAVSLVVDIASAFEKVQIVVVWQQAMADQQSITIDGSRDFQESMKIQRTKKTISRC